MKQLKTVSRGYAINDLLESTLSEDDKGGKSPFSFKSELTLSCPPRLVCAITKTWHEREELLRQCEDCVKRQEGQCGAWQSSP